MGANTTVAPEDGSTEARAAEPNAAGATAIVTPMGGRDAEEATKAAMAGTDVATTAAG